MVQDLIRYDILAQEALRGVIRKVLAEVATTGLPGNHHFFITFLTGAPGVRISSRLKEKYPEQMTVVLQHQFWDMLVTDQLFEVGLSFGDIPEKLTVPFSAIRGFYDPSVNFELEFDVSVIQPTSDNDEGDEVSSIELIPSEETPEKPQKSKSRPRKTAAEKENAAKKAKETTGEQEKTPKSSADVVSLDAFRKK
ncbi:SspB family protein [Falsochrobactrum sp. TDYN1]|uniref:SspB family protein n=1 Tax=Falsochrobactrum tianjinense TaxID=2706015 RepID=A0A949UUL2_9HYPH|nr:SspB family protein [Falsochrobactrum sp. TDYN1]MBV2143907.1 SspB family protein [Falsochrobactrum sp. TDYN1]